MSSLLTVSAQAGDTDDLVESRWVGTIDGSFWDFKNWTNGLPGSLPSINHHAIFDAHGDPYTVRVDGFDFIDHDIVFSTMTIDSDDVTLEVFDSYSGMIQTTSELNLLRGTLSFQGGGFRGSETQSRLNISKDFNFTLSGPSFSLARSGLFNYDVYGGDLVINTDIDDDHRFEFFDSSVREGALIMRGNAIVHVNSTVDYDVRLEPVDGIAEFRTGLLDIEIAEGTTISGTNLRVSGSTGRFQSTHTGWFINNGTIHHEDGNGSTFRTTNNGTVRVSGGTFQVYDSNDGLMEVNNGAHLFTTLYRNDDNTRSFFNYGTIDISGADSLFNAEANGDRFDRLELFRNDGIIRVTDHGTLRLSAMNLDALGTIERDETSTVQVVDYLHLQGQTVDRHTFGGSIQLESAQPGDPSSSYPNGVLYGGTVDISGDWIDTRGRFAGFSNTEIINGNLVVGDLLLSRSSAQGSVNTLNLDDVSIRDGDLIIGHDAEVRFIHMDPLGNYESVTYFNDTIRTIPTLRANAEILVGSEQLVLGKDSYVEGRVTFRGGGGSAIRLINEGVIVANSGTNSIAFNVATENRGVISSTDVLVGSNGVFVNTGSLLLDNAEFNGHELTNSGFISLEGLSRIRADFQMTLTDDSVLKLDAYAFAERIIVNRNIALDGRLILNLANIHAQGVFELIQAQSFSGEFDEITIIGLESQLEFGGFDSTSGYITIIPSPATAIPLLIAPILHRRRRQWNA